MFICAKMPSLPSREVWIEIRVTDFVPLTLRSLPVREVWIEMGGIPGLHPRLLCHFP